MVNRPKGITLIVILYSLFALATGFGIFSTEQAGDLVEERYGDKLKLYFFFDYDKNLAIITGGVELLVLVGLVILLINRSSKARIGVLSFEIYSIGLTVITWYYRIPSFLKIIPITNYIYRQ